jgi:hypothetical protein
MEKISIEREKMKWDMKRSSLLVNSERRRRRRRRGEKLATEQLRTVNEVNPFKPCRRNPKNKKK